MVQTIRSLEQTQVLSLAVTSWAQVDQTTRVTWSKSAGLLCLSFLLMHLPLRSQ